MDKELVDIIEIETNDRIQLNEESVAIERFTPSELKKSLHDHPENFGDAYYFVLESFYPDYLPQGYIKRWT